MNIGPNSKCIVRLTNGNRPVTVLGGADIHGLLWRGQDDETKDLYLFFTAQILTMNTIPHRFSRANFDRYADALGAALRAFPAPIEVDPSPYSVETYASRFRDAREAKKRYGYEHPHVDNVLFTQYADELSVAIQTRTLLIGPRAAIRAKTESQAGTVQTPASKDQVQVQATVEALEAVCSLLDKRHLSPPPKFFVRGLNPDIISSLEQRYDVAFAPSDSDPTVHHIL